MSTLATPQPAAVPAPVSPLRARIAWATATTTLVLAFGWALTVVVTNELSDEPWVVGLALASVSGFAVVGAMITSRTDNAVGWCLLGVAAAFGTFVAGGSYATYAYEVLRRPLPLSAVAALVASLAFFVSLMLVGAIPVLFPTGRARWPWLWHVYRVAAGVTLLGFAILPDRLTTFTDAGPMNPFGLEAWEGVVGTILAVSSPVLIVAPVLGVVTLVLRYRRSRGDERQQIRWFTYVVIAAVPLLAISVAIEFAVGQRPTGLAAVAVDVSSMAFFSILLIGMPVAIGVAILKYRLYDLDVVIRKALVAGAMALLFSGAYAVVVGAGSQLFDSGALSFVAAAGLALAFQPVLARTRHFVDHLVYGRRASPYEVLSEFADHVGAGYAGDEVLERMVAVLASGTGAASATVWLMIGGRMRPAATWPADAPPSETVPDDAVPVLHRGEVLGALSVEMPASDPIDTTRERLVRDLAAQAGLVLRNVRLIEELRASRQRLVAAQDEERRKIERNIHDGAQQQLVALTVKLRLLQQIAERDPSKASAMADQLREDATQALDDLRDLARGIYPPLLADGGLAAALDAQARRSAIEVEVTAEGLGRYPQEVESAVYFCCLEALQNVAKYAQASRATVTLYETDGLLRFAIVDDGSGFDAASVPRGTGLQGMTDRLDAIGGTLEVRSTPGAGTTVNGAVPVGRVQGSDGAGDRVVAS